MIFKQHKWVWIIYIVITAVALIVGLITSATLNMWDITFAFLIISPMIALAWFVKQYNEYKLNQMAKEYKAKSSIMRASIIWSLISSFAVVIPMIVAVIVDVIISNYFNLYMIISLYVAYYISYYGVKIIHFKKVSNLEAKTQKGE